MLKYKRGELDEVMLTITLIIGVLLITTWFIFYIGKLTMQDQNTNFLALNKVTQYYKLTCDADEAQISQVKIETIRKTNLTIIKNEVCIYSEGMLKICNQIICNTSITNNLNYNFNLKKTDYFTFNKKNDIITISKN